MSYTFKLSRRVARHRTTLLVAVPLLILGCNGDGGLNDPASPPSSTDPGSMAVSPDSASVGMNQSLPSDGSTDTSTAPSALARGGKKGRNITVVSLAVSPATVTLSPAGAQRFTAIGTSRDGSTTQPAVTWVATGGAIDSSGLYTAGAATGNYRVIARASDGLADTAAVTISSTAPVLARVELSPASTSVPVGGSQQFTALGKSSDGTTVPIAPRFSATGGTISSSGVYSAGNTAGTYRVIAADSASGKADTSAVTITSATLQAVALTPTSVSLAAGATQQFTASGTMSDGSTAPITASFAATGGTISSSGLYTAGATAGTFRVIASQSGGTLADTAAVTITASTPPPTSGTTYFLADGESGTVVPPFTYLNPANAGLNPTNATAQAKHGSRSYKFEIPATTLDPNKSQVLIGSPQVSMGDPGNRFVSGYYSFYTYVDAGYTQSGKWNMLLGWMTGVNGSPQPIAHIGLEVRTGGLQVVAVSKTCSIGLFTCPAIAGYAQSGGWYTMTAQSPAGIVTFPRGRWVHLSVYYKMSKTNGQITIWQDGVKIMDLTAPTLDTFDGTTGLTNTSNNLLLQFGIYGPAASEARRIYVDDFRVSNYRPVP
jgi:hypothetical protein